MSIFDDLIKNSEDIIKDEIGEINYSINSTPIPKDTPQGNILNNIVDSIISTLKDNTQQEINNEELLEEIPISIEKKEETKNEQKASSESSTSTTENKETVEKKLDEKDETAYTNKTPIIEFAQLILGTKFQNELQKNCFQKAGFSSLLDTIRDTLAPLYYNLYTVPNLPNNSVFIVKPETLFIKIPTCNIIVPCMKSQISYTRNMKSEPTRAFITTRLCGLVSGNTLGNSSLATIAAVENDEKIDTIPVLGADDKGMYAVADYPIYKITPYESQNGVRLLASSGGEEVATFIESVATSNTGEKDKLKYSAEELGKVLRNLARYELAKSRYTKRSGSINMYFNPFITPGYPFASIENLNKENKEPKTNSLNIFGYITDVVHNITPSSWGTTVTYSAGHLDDEDVPSDYPVIETEYKPENILETYKKTFLSSDSNNEVHSYTPLEAVKYFNSINITDATTNVSDVYKIISKERQATTLKEYLFNIVSETAEVRENEGTNNTPFLSIENYNGYYDDRIHNKVLQVAKRVFNRMEAINSDETR